MNLYVILFLVVSPERHICQQIVFEGNLACISISKKGTKNGFTFIHEIYTEQNLNKSQIISTFVSRRQIIEVGKLFNKFECNKWKNLNSLE